MCVYVRVYCVWVDEKLRVAVEDGGRFFLSVQSTERSRGSVYSDTQRLW